MMHRHFPGKIEQKNGLGDETGKKIKRNQGRENTDVYSRLDLGLYSVNPKRINHLSN